MAEQDDSAITENSSENSSSGAPQLDPWKFKPGQSGNPGGRPKKKPITELCEQILSDPKVLAKLQKAFIKGLSEGNVPMISQIWDRIEGKVTRQVEHSGRMTLEELICASYDPKDEPG